MSLVWPIDAYFFPQSAEHDGRRRGTLAPSKTRITRASTGSRSGRSSIGKAKPNHAMKTQPDISIQTPDEILNELRSLVIEAEKILGNDTTGVRSEGTVAALRERLEAAQERLASFYEGAKQKMAKGA